MPITTPELDEFDMYSKIPNIGANTIDHPGNDYNPIPHPVQPQDNSSIPQLEFDPNDPDNSAMGAPALGNLSMQDSEGVKADVEVSDDDFDYDDV